MTTKRIILLSFVVVLVILPFVVRYYRDVPPELESEWDNAISFEDILATHERRIKDRIEMLKKQSLDETFVYLLEDPQYFYPGYHPQAEGPRDMERILSTRGFLKVFQQFDALPRKQAVKKLHEFCKRAIKEFEDSLDNALWQSANPSQAKLETMNIMGAKYTVCVSMLLAARVGDHQLLLNQIEEMQPLVDSYVDKAKVNCSPEFAAIMQKNPLFVDEHLRSGTTLDGDCILTVLMYALIRAGIDASIPFEVNVKLRTIPLCRWDAPLTNYDFEVIRGKELAPQDVVEQFDVYYFSGDAVIDPQRRKIITDTLKERLSELFQYPLDPLQKNFQ